MNIQIRPRKTSDIPNLVKYADNWNIAKNFIDKFPHPLTEKDAETYIEFTHSDDPVHLFAIDKDGEAIGAIGLTLQADIYSKNVEIGLLVSQAILGTRHCL